MHLFRKIDWTFWMSDQAIPVGLFWDPLGYFFLPRICVLLLTTLAMVVAAAFAVWCFQRWTGMKVIVWD
jgi:hypothetical protein